MGVSGTVFKYIGVSMGYLYELMGTLLGSCVVPIALALTWKKANRHGCTFGAIAGLVFGIMAWIIVAAKLNDGTVDLDTTFQDFPMLAGSALSKEDS